MNQEIIVNALGGLSRIVGELDVLSESTHQSMGEDVVTLRTKALIELGQHITQAIEELTGQIFGQSEGE